MRSFGFDKYIISPIDMKNSKNISLMIDQTLVFLLAAMFSANICKLHSLHCGLLSNVKGAESAHFLHIALPQVTQDDTAGASLCQAHGLKENPGIRTGALGLGAPHFGQL